MRTHGHPALIIASLMVALLGAFHIARPVAVSAQASASVRVSATVVRADAAWSGHEMSQALVQAAAVEALLASATDPASESARTAATHGQLAPATHGWTEASVQRNGTVAWVEPIPASPSERTVFVAHLGS